MKTFQRLVKQFQSIPEREFQTGRSKRQMLEHIRSVQDEPKDADRLRTYLYDHDPDIRRAAVQALATLSWQPSSAADRQIWSLYTEAPADFSDVRASQFLADWEAKTSLAPGAYWTPVVLAGLSSWGTKGQHDLHTLILDRTRSVNTRAVALWGLGLFGGADGRDMRDVYAQKTNLRLQRTVVQSLRFSGSASIPYLTGLLLQEHDADMCMDLALALAWQGRDAVPDLTPLLESESRTVREYAGMALLATAAPEALHAVFGLRSSRDDGRLKSLITEWLIALQGTPSTWNELSSPGEAGRLCAEQRILQAVNRVEDESVITILVSMLAHVPGRAAVPAITEMIRGSDREEFIFQACQILGARQAEAELELMLGQGNTLIRTFACLALLQAGFPVMQVLAEC